MIFLHGYGADGNDLIGLADPLSTQLPDTEFRAPNAPERCTGNPMGYQWFPIPWIDGSTEEQAMAGMGHAADLLNTYLDDVAKESGIGPENTVIVGFSQGTMIALEVLYRRKAAVAGVVGFSGRLMRPEATGEFTVKPPVILIHGDKDDVVPPASLPEAADAMVQAGVETYAHVMEGTAHGIAPDGLAMALQFIKKVLP